MTSYYALLNKLETFFNAHLQVKKFGGEFREQMPNFSTMDERYPLVYVVPTSEISGMNTNVFTLEVYCVDIIQKDRANINTILSDTQLILNDLYLYYTDGTDLSVTVITDPTMTPLNNFDLDYVAGWVGTFTFEVDQYSVCAIPLEPIIPVTNECPPASYLVEYENGTDIQEGTIPSGGSLTIQVPNPTECLPATVNLVNTDLTLLLTESVDCNTTEQIIAPDGFAKIKLTGDGTLVNLQVPSGATIEYDIPDNEITVNGGNLFTIDATEPLDIRLKDQNANTITAQSVTHNQNQDHVDIVINTASFVPVGATLQKTGQTTSYRTGDDGDLEAGRLTNFLTLPSNNPFGNTNRFTSTLGTQTYTNQIYIDWSTYNGLTVLGYYKLNSSLSHTWTQAVDWGFSLSIGGFTSGWRLPNINELMNLMNFSLAQNLNYSPINLTALSQFSSTTSQRVTTNAFEVIANSDTPIFERSKVSSRNTIFAVRTFTVNGTNIT